MELQTKVARKLHVGSMSGYVENDYPDVEMSLFSIFAFIYNKISR